MGATIQHSPLSFGIISHLAFRIFLCKKMSLTVKNREPSLSFQPSTGASGFGKRTEG